MMLTLERAARPLTRAASVETVDNVGIQQ
jgi:hypothetical protein